MLDSFKIHKIATSVALEGSCNDFRAFHGSGLVLVLGCLAGGVIVVLVVVVAVVPGA